MSTTAVAETFTHQGIVPGYLLAQLAASDRYAHAAQAAKQTLIAGRPTFHSTLELSIGADGALMAEVTAAPTRTIFDAQNSTLR